MADPEIPPKPGTLANVGKVLMQDMRRRTDTLKSQLEPIMLDAQNSIDEQAFILYFLPLFAGEYGTDAVKIQTQLSQWYRVAGSPYASVNVTSGGRIVAVVPAVKTNILTGKPTGLTEDVGSIFNNAAQQATISPRLGHHITVVALHQRYMTNIPRPDLTEEQKKWFELLNRYGKAPKSLMTTAPANSALTASKGDEDELVYD